MTNTTIFFLRVRHLNTLSKVLFLQMPKGRKCCCFKLNIGSPFALGLTRKSFSPDGCWLNLHLLLQTNHKISLFLGKKLMLLLIRLSISVKAVGQQLCASWHLWFLLTQSCQTNITVSRKPKALQDSLFTFNSALQSPTPTHSGITIAISEAIYLEKFVLLC